MDDKTCVEFLQWALPLLKMRWAGFRKVRKQVCKRIARRFKALRLRDVTAYRDYLLGHCEEWTVVDDICRISISRFFRDRLLFSSLQRDILPELLRQVKARGETMLHIWSAGCAAGEEPYSLSILWGLGLSQRAADAQMNIDIIATDSDQRLLERAIRACYPYSSLKNLPEDWRQRAFVENNKEFCLCAAFRHGVNFVRQDLRLETPPGIFDLIMCRNLVFTYFEDNLQRQILRRLANILRPGGLLVIGIHETLPQDYDGFAVWSQRLGVYQRRS